MAKIIVVTSGKGGVGKTTSTAAIGAGLAMRGKKTVVIDFDVGLRNLDMIMGCERRVVFDFINVIQGDAKLKQALITDRRLENLAILPTSQTRDKDALTREGVEKVLDELREQFDYVICDSPAGIERGAHLAMYYADEAVVVTNPEVSSVRDSDRVLGLLSSKTHRAEKGEGPVKSHLLLTRYDAQRVARGEMMKVDDILEILSIPLLGIIPESTAVLKASNIGTPVVFDAKSTAGKAYEDAVSRLVGEQIEMRLQPERPGLFQRLLREDGVTMLNFFRRSRNAGSADTAKERLQILLSHERSDRSSPEYLPMLQRDILQVIERYMRVGDESVDIKLERGDELSTLEINIELPGARALHARGAA